MPQTLAEQERNHAETYARLKKERADRTALMFRRCGIHFSREDDVIKGQLGTFTFGFSNYYTMVNGMVPLAVAEELYAMTDFREIRVAGHCGCPPPSEWATFFKDEKIVGSHKEYLTLTEGSLKGSKIAAELIANPKYHWAESDNRSMYAAFITHYHIDSELALYIFVQTLKKHKLV